MEAPVLLPGKDPARNGVVFGAGPGGGTYILESATAWPMGCGWASYP